jgi:CHASE2 domain-containing sensor protein
MRWVASRLSPPDEVVLVAIDNPSLHALGRWSWPRARHARVIDELARGGAKAVYMDVGIFDPDRNGPENDRRLIESTAASGIAVYPMVFDEVGAGGAGGAGGGEGKRVVPLEPIPELAGAAAAVAHAHMEPGSNGVVRSVHLACATADRTYWGPSVELLRLNFGLPKAAIDTRRSGVVTIGDVDVPVLESRAPAPASVIPALHGWSTRCGLFSRAGSGPFRRVSAADVIDGRSPAGVFDGKIVLYGMTATGLGDSLTTPMSSTAPMPGIEVQANVVGTILRRRFLRPVGAIPVGALTVLASMAVAWLYGRSGALPAFWLLVGIVAVGSVLYLVAFARLGLWMEMTPAEAGAVLSFIGSSVAYRRR